MRIPWSYFVAELVATFILVLIGDGALASYVVTRKPVEASTVCMAFGVGAMIASFVSAKISGAHTNPAASLALAVEGKLSWSLLPVYVVAQYVGAFLAALLLYVNYLEAISSLDGGQRVAYGGQNATGGIFATYPAEYTSVWGALFDQMFGTGMLLFAMSALSDRRNLDLELRHQPLFQALIIGFTCLAFSPNCGAIFNPARDLSPRIVTFIMGYPGVWQPVDHLYWLVAGVLGPHLGALVGVFAYRFLIGSALESRQRLEWSPSQLPATTTGHQLEPPASAPTSGHQPPADQVKVSAFQEHQPKSYRGLSKN